MTVEILPWSAGTGPPIAIEIHHPVCSKILSARLATVRGSFSMFLISRVVNIMIGFFDGFQRPLSSPQFLRRISI